MMTSGGRIQVSFGHLSLTAPHLLLISFEGATIGRLKLTRPVLDDAGLAVFFLSIRL
jgi:hypothetical protein